MFGKNKKREEMVMTAFNSDVEQTLSKLKEDFTAVADDPDAGSRYIAYRNLAGKVTQEKYRLEKDTKSALIDHDLRQKQAAVSGIGLFAAIGGLLFTATGVGCGEEKILFDGVVDYVAAGGLAGFLGGISSIGITERNENVLIKRNQTKIEDALAPFATLKQEILACKEDMLNNYTDEMIQSPHLKTIIQKDSSLKDHFFAHSLKKNNASNDMAVFASDKPIEKLDGLQL